MASTSGRDSTLVIRSWALVSFLFPAVMSSAERAGTEILTLDRPDVVKRFVAKGATVEFIPASEGHRAALKIVAEGSGPASVRLASPTGCWNWSGYAAVGVELENPGAQAMFFGLSLIEAGGGAPRSSGNGGQLGPRSRFSVAAPIGAALPMNRGMRGGPPYPGYIPPPFITKDPIDETRIAALEIELQGTQPGRSLLLTRLELLPLVSYDGIVDRFGQYTRLEWPGKMHQEEELLGRRNQEEAGIERAPALPGRDAFGGWSAGPQLAARGFFYSCFREGKWWLVTPAGHLFLSFGVNAIDAEEPETLITGREQMFSWLPGDKDPLARLFKDEKDILYGPIRQGKAFNFYEANLQRKYGADYIPRFLEAVNQRLRSWGFNTIANWSDPRLHSLHEVPYTATIDIDGDFARVSSGIDYWGKMTDPFDPRFREAVQRSLETHTAKYHDDPWCIGYFIDNEISWGGMGSDREHFGLAIGTLKEGGASPAKQAFTRLLQQRYPSVAALNAAWGTQFKSWELSAPDSPGPDLARATVKADCTAFLREFARQYFRVVKEGLAATDPNHLYLGCRFAWRIPEAVDAAGEFCDVVSFNIYERTVDPGQWAFAAKLNKPCIIGEFHFGAIDRGMFHPGLVAAHDQLERARMYVGFVHSVVDHPAFVGCGWFEYIDEPLTGRTYDGENYSIGLVDVTDTPYPELIEAARQVHADAYARRAGRLGGGN